VFTGTLVLDLRLGDVHSLKGKRAVVRPILAELRRRYPVSAAEVGDTELHRRTQLGVAVVAGEAGRVGAVLEDCERFVAGRPEVELLSVQRRLHSSQD